VTTTVALVAAWMAGGYLAGSLPFGWLIGKLHGYDIRRHGSRNIGATNCGRVCGWPWGVLAFALDVAKGTGPVLAAVAWLPPLVGFEGERGRWLATVLAAVAPILGHVFPCWLGFRGGKGVATSLGVVLAMPMLRWAALAALGIWCLAVLVTRYVSVASTVAALVFAGLYGWLERAEAGSTYLAVSVFVGVVAGVVIVRHRSNYARLMRGTENKVLAKKNASDKPGG